MSADKTREIEIAEIAVIMGTTGGRAFIARMLDASGAFYDTFDTDPHKHAYKAGKRSAGLWLVSELSEAAPYEYTLLLRERDDDHRSPNN